MITNKTPEQVHSPQEIDALLFYSFANSVPTKHDGIEYYDDILAFDIEVSSFRDPATDEKRACMYVWQLAIDGEVIVGRTWDEYDAVMARISDYLGLNPKKRVVVWVHNLAYEFQFLRRRAAWHDVFAVDTRKPVRACTTNGIEYRCSLILSGYSLASLGKQLTRHDIRKATGDLDYSLVRTCETPLTETELGYCINDVLVVSAYIEELLDSEEHVYNIPMTKTGYVRRYVRAACIGSKADGRTSAQWKYANKVQTLRLTDDEYAQLKRAFSGGFTHSNPWHTNETLHDVSSYDFTSSYPTVMLAEKYPMSCAERVNIRSAEELQYNLNRYCCMFDIELHNVRPRTTNDYYLSSSKCPLLEGAKLSNGRIVSAERLITTITDPDYDILRRAYEWDGMRIANFRRYRRGYLPTPFVKSILKLYADKTELKGVPGMENEYQVAKGMLNSCYGMIVTDIAQSESIYDADVWADKPADIHDSMRKYNEDKSRFLYYPWGVWITAYARRNLWSGILAAGDDYVYSDTDSVKMLHADQHVDYINKYNAYIVSRLEAAMEWHGLPADAIAPRSVDGVAHPLGVWDYEGTYSTFKTLGAKRYLVEEDGALHITVAGMSKRAAVYLQATYSDPFAAFAPNLRVPAGPSGRTVHTYIDYPTAGTITDYTGHEASYAEMSAVNLEESAYSMDVAEMFLRYVLEIKGVRNGSAVL